MWNLIQGELLDENNSLPKNIRENILNLSLLIDKRIFNIMAYPSPEKLNIIIDSHNGALLDGGMVEQDLVDLVAYLQSLK